MCAKDLGRYAEYRMSSDLKICYLSVAEGVSLNGICKMMRNVKTTIYSVIKCWFF